MRLILASASPRRAELLRAAGFEFQIVVTNVDESIRPGEPPERYVRRLAAEKSAAARSPERTAPPGHESAAPPSPEMAAPPGPESAAPFGPERVALQESPEVVLAADTTVVVDGHILGKPADDADAARMLRRLSGRVHHVLTGVSVRMGAIELGRVEATAVTFASLTDADIAWYVASGEGRDKAGAYAIQGLASRFVPRIDGSYSNVVGLPVACIWELLREISGTPPDRACPGC